MIELKRLLGALYDHVVASSGVWLLAWTSSGQIVYISQPLATLSGQPASSWLGQPIQRLIEPPASGVSAALWAIDALPAATASCQPLSLQGHALWLATFRPLTLTSLDWIDHISDPAVVLDLELHILRYNAGAASLYGGALLKSGTIEQLIPSSLDEDDPTRDTLLKLLAKRGQWRGELPHLSDADGLLRLHTTFSLITSPSGQPEGVLVLSHPATQEARAAQRRAERQRLERALVLFSRHIGLSSGDEEDYPEALEALREGLGVWRACLVLSHRGAPPALIAECVQASPPALVRRPLPPHDALRDALATGDLFAGPLHALPADYAGALAAEGVRRVALLPLLHQDELLGYMRFDDVADEAWPPDDLRLLQLAAAQLVAALVRADATSRQRALEDRIIQTQKMESLGLLAGGVAHDFKNLLIGIIANAQFARDELRDEPRHLPLVDALNDVLLAGRRAGDLVHQMLTYAGRSSAPSEPLSLNALAEEVLVLLRPSLHSRVVLHKELPQTLPLIHGDGAQLSQLILNLLLNASEALPERGGQLWLRSGACELDAAQLAGAIAGYDSPAPGLYAFIEIEDNGSGIAPEQLPRVFDPFYTNKANGRGLGLAVVLGAVRAHQGALFIESRFGQGTRIRAAIPAMSQPAPTRRRVESGVFEGLPPSARRRHVVVVDDEPVVRALAQRIFDRYQVPVLLCSSGPEFLDLLDSHHEQIGLVLLDFSMPGMSGLDVLAALRPQHPDLPVFLSSGFEQELMTGIEDDPYTHFIAKPYTPVSLMRQLQPALEQSKD